MCGKKAMNIMSLYENNEKLLLCHDYLFFYGKIWPGDGDFIKAVH